MEVLECGEPLMRSLWAMSFTTHDTISVMVWECISVYGTGHMVVVDGNLNGFVYISTL